MPERIHTLSESVPLGKTLAGKFRVDRVIGAGGIGIVASGTDLVLERPVALKFLNEATRSNPELVKRLFQEAKVVARLKSKHVTSIHDVQRADDGSVFIVMELLEGDDLARVLEREGRIEASRAVDWMLEAADALSEAHARGVIHRDIKPSNLFATRDSRGDPLLKVLDFGVAKELDTALTDDAKVIGSPRYMSPEQMESAATVDARSDIWAMGVTLYELVTARPPFHADGVAALCRAVMHEAPPAFAAHGVQEAGLEAVVRRCLQKRPERRYQSVAELALALEPFAGERGPLAARLGRGAIPTSSEPAGDTTFEGDALAGARVDATPSPVLSQQGKRASRSSALVLGGVAVAVAGIAYAVSTSGPSGSSTGTLSRSRFQLPAVRPEPPPVTTQSTPASVAPPALSSVKPGTRATPAVPRPPAAAPSASSAPTPASVPVTSPLLTDRK